MDHRAEQFVAKAKSGLENVRRAINASPGHWISHLSAVRTCVSYVDQSGIMHYPHRIEERMWIIKEVQSFACTEPENNGIPELSAWCERELNQALHEDPNNFAALAVLGEIWLAKAQPALDRIHRQEAALHPHEDDERAHDSRTRTSDYREAQQLLHRAVTYLAQAVSQSHTQGRLSGSLLAKSAEASMSYGNVSKTRDSRQPFIDAVNNLKAAKSMSNYRLPPHLSVWLRENEYILKF
ncbi:hypothetical protein EDC01DRAFT_649601 [Geopyxis carbonaria]|nr:hypothetical protein EDC01DRAFT_649601 [Geopyxis carbonaria]